MLYEVITHYKLSDDVLVITNYSAAELPVVRLHVKSKNGKKYKFLVTNQITMDVNEYGASVRMTSYNFV